METERDGYLETHIRANLRFWLETIALLEGRLLHLGFESLERRTSDDEQHRPDPMVEQFMTAHLLVLALHHIHQRLRRLSRMRALSDEAERVANAYFREFDAEELKDLRDAMEHSDDYATGTGKYQERIGLLREGWLPGVRWRYSAAEGEGEERTRVSRIRLFGRDYEVERILDVVRSIDSVL